MSSPLGSSPHCSLASLMPARERDGYNDGLYSLESSHRSHPLSKGRDYTMLWIPGREDHWGISWNLSAIDIVFYIWGVFSTQKVTEYGVTYHIKLRRKCPICINILNFLFSLILLPYLYLSWLYRFCTLLSQRK